MAWALRCRENTPYVAMQRHVSTEWATTDKMDGPLSSRPVVVFATSGRWIEMGFFLTAFFFFDRLRHCGADRRREQGLVEEIGSA